MDDYHEIQYSNDRECANKRHNKRTGCSSCCIKDKIIKEKNDEIKSMIDNSEAEKFVAFITGASLIITMVGLVVFFVVRFN